MNKLIVLCLLIAGCASQEPSLYGKWSAPGLTLDISPSAMSWQTANAKCESQIRVIYDPNDGKNFIIAQNFDQSCAALNNYYYYGLSGKTLTLCYTTYQNDTAYQNCDEVYR